MKILIVVGIFPPDIGGPATFVPLIAKKLVENNYQTEVICLSDSLNHSCLLYTSPSPRDGLLSRMPSSA